MSKEIMNLFISEKKLDNGDSYIGFSKVDKKDKKTYKDLIEKSLSDIFNNKLSINENINNLDNLLKNKKWTSNFSLLKKGSRLIEKFLKESIENTNDKPLENVNINIIFYEKIENRFNILSFFVDIAKSKNNDNFVIELKRLEYLDNNLDNNFSFANSNSFDLKLSLSEESTSQISISNLFKNNIKEIKSFNDDDYDKDKDKLKINKWFDYLNLFYDANKENDKIVKDNELIANDLGEEKEFILCSKIEIKNLDNVVLMKNIKNSDIYEENGEYKKIKYDSHLTRDKFIKSIEQENNKITNQLIELNKEINDIENKLNFDKNELNVIDDSIIELDYNYRLQSKKYEELNLELESSKKEYKQFLIKKESSKIDENEKYLFEQQEENLNQIIKDIDEKFRNYFKNYEDNFNKTESKNNFYDFVKNKILGLKKEIEISENSRNELTNSIKNYKHQIDTKSELKEEIEKKQKNINTFIETSKSFKSFYKIPIKEFDIDDIKINLFEDTNGIINLKYNYSYSLVPRNNATTVKIRRLKDAINNLVVGDVRNFNLYNAVKNPSELFLRKDFDQSIVKKNKLNKKQIEAIEKTINTNDIMYLQGPPGTGKTQVLSSIAKCFIKDNKNILMCSSTHAAIENFFDRLYKENYDKPYIIIHKISKTLVDQKEDKKSDQFDETNLFKNFKNSIYNYHLKNTEDNSKLNDLLKKYIENYGKELPKEIVKKDKMPMSFLETLIENIESLNKNRDLILDSKEDYIWPLTDIYNIELTKEDLEECSEKINRFYSQKLSRDNNLKKQFELIDEIIRSAKIKDIKLLFSNDLISKLMKSNVNLSKSNSFVEKLKILKNKELLDFNEESKFLDYIFENNLINVIGSTTTSKQTIEIKNKIKHLFHDYNIDLLMIDEVSKSCTPEIISKAVLSKKTILSGDYKQLPPVPDFNTEQDVKKVIDFLKNNSDLYRKKFSTKQENFYARRILDMVDDNTEEETIIKNFQKIAEELFKTSFFVEQVKKIKSNNISNSCYTFLNECYRFSGTITNLVNIFYDYDEKLISKKELSSINKFDLKTNNKNLDNELVLLDIVNSKDYFSKIHDLDLDKFPKSFDQVGKCFKLRGNKLHVNAESSYNQ